MDIKDLKFLKHKKVFRKQSIEVNQNAYWYFIVSLFLLVFASVLVFCYMRFNKLVEKVDIIANQPEINIDLVQKEAIEKTLKYFDTKEKNSQDIKNAKSLIIDPSL